jgi:siderophore-mediated iron transport protein tonB
MSNYSKPRSIKKEAEDLQKYVGIYLDNCHKHGVKPTWDRLIAQASIAVSIPESRIRTDRHLQAALIQGRDNYYRMNKVYNRLNPPPKPKKKPAPKPTTQEKLVPPKEQKPETQKQQLPKPETKKEEGKQMAQPEKNNPKTLEKAQQSIQAFVDSKPNGFTRAAYRKFSKNRPADAEQILSESQLRDFFSTWGEAAVYANAYAKKCEGQGATKQVKKAAPEKARPAAKKPVNKPEVKKLAPKKPSKKQDKPAPKATKPAQPKDATTEPLSEIVAEAFKNMRTEGSLLHQFAQFVANLFEGGYLLRELLLVFEQNEITEDKGSWKQYDAIIKHLDENPQDERQLKLLLAEVLHDVSLQGSLNASK